MRSRTGTLYTQKVAHLYGRATSTFCLLCYQPIAQIHMPLVVKKASIQSVAIERHNIASRLTIKIFSEREFGGSIIFGIGVPGWLNKA